MEQPLHPASVTPVEYAPAVHDWQMVLLMYLPGWHDVQVLAEPSELVFAGQGLHALSVPSTK